jgi:hypothetical protein
MRILRNLDLVALALALPVWVAAALPLLGWAATTAAWIGARLVQSRAEAKALQKGSRQAALGARAASLFARLFLVTGAVLVAGIIEREAGLSGGVLAVIVFTIWFVSLLIFGALEEAGR